MFLPFHRTLFLLYGLSYFYDHMRWVVQIWEWETTEVVWMLSAAFRFRVTEMRLGRFFGRPSSPWILVSGNFCLGGYSVFLKNPIFLPGEDGHQQVEQEEGTGGPPALQRDFPLIPLFQPWVSPSLFGAWSPQVHSLFCPLSPKNNACFLPKE